MATYTITINERTKEGKSLLNYLDSLGLICHKPDKNAISEAMMNKTIDYSKPVNNRKINGVIVYENEEGKMKEFRLGHVFCSQNSDLSEAEQYRECFESATRALYRDGYRYMFVSDRGIPTPSLAHYSIVVCMFKDRETAEKYIYMD
ncbi:MAG: hypothetical protein ACFN20_07930 [Bacteroidota bacterium]|jgi:hypothetical protein